MTRVGQDTTGMSPLAQTARHLTAMLWLCDTTNLPAPNSGEPKETGLVMAMMNQISPSQSKLANSATLTADPSRSARRGTLQRRTAKCWRIALMMALGTGVIGLGGASPASAATDIKYDHWTYCQQTSYTSYGTWQQTLSGSLPTTTIEALYGIPPSALTAYQGTTEVTWSASIAYLGVDGAWYWVFDNGTPDMTATATSAYNIGGDFEYIGWSVPSFARAIPPGRQYAVYATTTWLDNQGQAIATESEFIPTSNC